MREEYHVTLYSQMGPREGRLVLQVHDELIAECPAEERAQVKRILTEEMEHAAALSVPLTVDAHCGKNWLEAKG